MPESLLADDAPHALEPVRVSVEQELRRERDKARSDLSIASRVSKAIASVAAQRELKALDRRLTDALIEGTPFRRAALLAPPSTTQPALVRLAAGEPLELVAIPRNSPLAAGAAPLERIIDGRETDLRQMHYGARGAYAIAPLRYDGHTAAIAYVDDLEPYADPATAVEAVAAIVEIASLARGTATLLADHARHLREASTLARVDALTLLPNRLALSELVRSELARAARSHAPLALALFDLDHFKSINDREGHAAGDAALRRFADALRRATREVDFPARLAGDEFVVVYIGSDERSARPGVERALEEIHKVRLASSIGVATARENDTAEDLIARADRGLYAAKHAGRDRIAFAGDLPEDTPVSTRA